VVNKGMIPKIENALRAIEAGVNSVIIQHSDNILSGKGTTIR
jgi:acetylglutamate kinase